MRTWRVGTISMGVSLLFLGVVLLLSQFAGLSLSHIMISWWPVILVVLGIEILVYLFLSRQEKPFIKYDFLSIIFVGIIGTVGIGFSILSATGLLHSVEDVLSREQKTFDLPAFSQSVNEDINRVVLSTEDHPITVEGTSDREVTVFGTYSTSMAQGEELVTKVEDYIGVQQKGDTLFVDIKELPYETIAFGNYYAEMQATVLIPVDARLEIVGEYNSITLKPRSLKSDWSIDRASVLSLFLDKNSDIQVSNVASENLIPSNETSLTGEETSVAQEKGTNLTKNDTFKTGNGTHTIHIVNSDQVSLNILE